MKDLVTKIRKLGSSQHTKISQSAFLTTPLPSMFHMERFHDHIISRNATRCVTSLRLITHNSTLKVRKVPAGKNLTSFSPAIPNHLTKGWPPVFTEPLLILHTTHFERFQQSKWGAGAKCFEQGQNRVVRAELTGDLRGCE